MDKQDFDKIFTDKDLRLLHKRFGDNAHIHLSPGQAKAWLEGYKQGLNKIIPTDERPPFEGGTDLSKVRNIGIFAHVDAGKTTIVDRVMVHTGRHMKARAKQGKGD